MSRELHLKIRELALRKEMLEYARKLRLEIAEYELLKSINVMTCDFESAAYYRDREKRAIARFSEFMNLFDKLNAKA